MSSRLALMVQAAVLGGQFFDLFSLFDDGGVASKVGVGWSYACLSDGLEWAQTGSRHGCSRRRSPIPAFATRVPATFDDAACAAYLEKARWGDGFACPHCGTAGEPFHFENEMRTPGWRDGAWLNVWFWAAYLVASQTPGMSAVQFQRQLGLSATRRPFKFSTSSARAWCGPTKTGLDSPRTMLRWTKPRANAWGRPWCSGSRLLCHCVIESRAPSSTTGKTDAAGRVRLAVVLDRSAESLCSISLIVTDDWSGYAASGMIRCCRVW